MARSLSEFTSEIKNRHVAKSSKFEVFLPPPSFMVENPSIYPTVNEDSKLVQIFAESVHFPEFVIETIPVRDGGQNREVAYNKIYPPIVCSFICDADMKVKKFFDDWVQGIMKTENGTFRYLNTYQISSMQIYQLNEQLQETYVITLNDVYPKMVNDIALSSSAKDFNRCQVQFVYRTWNSEKL